MGEAGSGKTTLLYTLCGFRDFATIPTIGFNIEDCAARDKSGWKFTLWDLGGGCGQARPLFKHYLTAEKFCIFLHDVSGDDLADESFTGFRHILEDCASSGCRQVWVVFSKQGLIRSEDERLEKLGSTAAKYRDLAAPFVEKVQVRILPLPGLDALNHTRTDEVLSEIGKVLQQQEATPRPAGHDNSATGAVAAISPSKEDLRLAVEEVLARLHQQPAEAFWKDFSEGTLASWDHAAHLRAGLGVILQGYLEPRGLFTWTDDFIGHLDRLREARPDLFRNTAHRTMTLFWLHRIHRALKGYMATTAAHDSQNTVRLPRLDEFPGILRADAHLMDKNLWRQFYSQGLMFSPRAKNEWCLPDVAMLPDTITTSPSGAVRMGRDRSGSSAGSFAGGDQRLPRFAFTVVKKAVASGARRGGIVKRALGVLQQVTMRKRAAAATTATDISPSSLPPPPPYSETQAYFWIQYVHACLNVLERGMSPQGSLQDLSFAAFQAMFAVGGDEWREFYTAGRWEDVGSRSQMVLPDRKQLPNVFPTPLARRLDRARSMLVQEASQTAGRFERGGAAAVEDVTEEELAFFADLVADEAEQLVEAGKADDQTGGQYCATTRAELLLFIFGGLTAADLDTHADVSAAAMRMAGGLRSDSRQAGGATQKLFWVRLVLDALMQQMQQQQEQQQQGQDEPASFGRFVRQHAALALDDLPWAYYSPQVWESAEAREGFVMPDRKALSSRLTAVRPR